MADFWVVDNGRLDVSVFFGALPDQFPEATTFFAEGIWIEQDVQRVYEAHLQAGDYLPGAHIIWPKSLKFRCEFSSQLCADLAELAERHVCPELLDHFFLYSGSEPLVYWPDAFANPILISGSIPESRVKAFSAVLNLPYRRPNAR